MPKISFDFNPHVFIGLTFFLAGAISSGTVHLTNAIPMEWIPAVTAWSGIISFCGNGYLSGALLLHNASPESRRDLAANVPHTLVATINGADKGTVAAALANVPGVQNVITTAPVAASVPSEKVIGTAADAVDAKSG